jgi:hypothetical protein
VAEGLAHDGVMAKAKAAPTAWATRRREKPEEVRAIMADAFKTKLQRL